MKLEISKLSIAPASWFAVGGPVESGRISAHIGARHFDAIEIRHKTIVVVLPTTRLANPSTLSSVNVLRAKTLR
jgi:hypothetical protein